MLKQLITPYGSRVLTSERVRRWRDFPDRLRHRLRKDQPRVTLFHQLDDPYSYLAIEASAQLVRRYNIDFELVVVSDEAGVPNNDSRQATENWLRYRLHDARRLARVWRMDEFVKVDRPNAEGLEASLRCLAAAPPSARAGLALKLTRALWMEDPQATMKLLREHKQGSDDDVKRLLRQGHDERAERGHYRAATWEFNGNWFWGMDRLEYLEDDLHRWKLARDGSSIYGEFFTPTLAPRLQAKTLDVFFSFRSPYSYLSLSRLNRLCDQYRGQIDVRYRPVLPMVERGVALSTQKRDRILRDAARVANKQQIAFGLIKDPLGPGLHRCMAVFDFARKRHREREFVLSVMQGVWAEGVSIHSERGLRKLTERAGLKWEEARSQTFDATIQDILDKNQQQLELMGLWGVPTFALTDEHNRLIDVFWGQDRLSWLEYGLNNRPHLSP